MTTYNKFSTWFVAQHGPRPSKKPRHELAVIMDSKVYAAAEVRRLWDACELWDAKQTSAHYAWQAREKNNGC